MKKDEFPRSLVKTHLSEKIVVMVVNGRLILLDSKSYSDNKPVFSLSLVVIHFSDNQ